MQTTTHNIIIERYEGVSIFVTFMCTTRIKDPWTTVSRNATVTVTSTLKRVTNATLTCYGFAYQLWMGLWFIINMWTLSWPSHAHTIPSYLQNCKEMHWTVTSAIRISDHRALSYTCKSVVRKWQDLHVSGLQTENLCRTLLSLFLPKQGTVTQSSAWSNTR